jgi:hypothetical protein
MTAFFDLLFAEPMFCWRHVLFLLLLATALYLVIVVSIVACILCVAIGDVISDVSRGLWAKLCNGKKWLTTRKP